MEIIQDDLWLCQDCTIYAVNGDTSGIESEKREKRVVEGVDALGPHLVPDYDSETGDGIDEFSWRQCDACGTRLGGERTRFAVLGETREEPLMGTHRIGARRPRGMSQENPRGSRLNNEERRLWVLNDEYLYKKWQASGQSQKVFIRDHRAEIDEYIRHGKKNPIGDGISGTELLLIAGGVGLVGLVGYLIYNANWSPAAQGASSWVAGQAGSPQISVAAPESVNALPSIDPSPNFCTNVGAVQAGSAGPSPAGGQSGYCWQDSGNTSVPAVGQEVAVMIYDYQDAQGNPITPTSSPYYGTVTAVDSNNNVTIAWGLWAQSPGTYYTSTFPLSYVVTGLNLIGAAVGV